METSSKKAEDFTVLLGAKKSRRMQVKGEAYNPCDIKQGYKRLMM
jgi:hypothetical protein